MGFTNQAFARKLSKLRGDFGQDLAELAGISGISAEKLAMLERADAQPSGDELLVLADCFKRDYQFLLSDEMTDGEAEVGMLFRTRGSDISPADRNAIAEFSYLCRCQARLEAELEVHIPAAGFSFQPGNAYFKGDATRCALTGCGKLASQTGCETIR